MAEKEERIYVRKYGEDNPCDTCEDKGGDECDFCMKNYEWNASITHQEAIRKMCDAYFKAKDKGLMESERVVAALNALLEGK